ncbi:MULTISPECIES: antitoxin Xre/MbcA/ParS toxin-binding domain-containing protein [unclassified Dyella]|uniref:antitoxin Xre/MbcA/ParS toxin-binding domain-containing protein n=1 Tax=unclassified Dyella TaxID=2634549 RepID=UPI003F8F325A
MAITNDLRVTRVMQVVEAISGDRSKAVAWLQEPLATFGGKTALELVAEGHYRGQVHFLDIDALPLRNARLARAFFF